MKVLNQWTKVLIGIAGIALSLGLSGCEGSGGDDGGNNSGGQLTLAMYNAIQSGTSYDQVASIIGRKEDSRMVGDHYYCQWNTMSSSYLSQFIIVGFDINNHAIGKGCADVTGPSGGTSSDIYHDF